MCSFNKFKPAFFLVLLLGFAGACKSPTQVAKVSIETKRVAERNEIAPYNPSRTRKIDLIHTKLELAFDWEKQWVLGTAYLQLRPYFYSQSEVELDAKGFDIIRVELEGGNGLDYKYDNEKLIISLDREYSRRDTLAIEIEYVAKPNELPVGGSEAIQQDKGLYFINPTGEDPMKPRQIWTQGETESNSKWFPTIDSPNERTTQELFITVDTSLTVLSNGELVYELNNGDGTKTEYWRMELPHAPYLFMLAVGEFAVIKDSWNGKEVNYYVEPEYAPYARTVFGNTPEMLSFFSEKLGYPYPWNKYSQIVVRDFVSGAMENTTASVFMEGLQIDDREALDVNWDFIIAHELFHHWFGDLVTCESWANLPLNEAFANYSEYLWSEYKYGRDEADYHGDQELLEYLSEAQTKKEPLIRFHYKDKEDMFDRHSYNKGGRVLHYLRNIVGDDAFFSALNLYLTNNHFKSVEIHDLRLAFEETTGWDMNWFFNQYFLSAGHPELRVKHSYGDGKISLSIRQIQDTIKSAVYKAPLKVAYWINDQQFIRDIVVQGTDTTIFIEVSQKPDLVQVDPEYVLPGVIDQEMSLDELAYQYEKSPGYLGRKYAFDNTINKLISEGAVNLIEHPVTRDMIKKGLSDHFWDIRKFSLQMLLNLPESALDYFKKDVETIAVRDEKPEVRATAIRVLANIASPNYREVFYDGLKAMPYSVVAASLSALLKSEEAGKVNPEEFEAINNLDVALSIAGYYVQSARTDKFEWFKAKLAAYGSKPRSLYNFLFLFGEYVTKMSNTRQREEAIQILQAVSGSTKYDVIRDLSNGYMAKLQDLGGH